MIYSRSLFYIYLVGLCLLALPLTNSSVNPLIPNP